MKALLLVLFLFFSPSSVSEPLEEFLMGISICPVLVLGNDIDVVSDYTVGLDPIISKFKPEAYA